MFTYSKNVINWLKITDYEGNKKIVRQDDISKFEEEYDPKENEIYVIITMRDGSSIKIINNIDSVWSVLDEKV